MAEKSKKPIGGRNVNDLHEAKGGYNGPPKTTEVSKKPVAPPPPPKKKK